MAGKVIGEVTVPCDTCDDLEISSQLSGKTTVGDPSLMVVFNVLVVVQVP